jgi:hypothetical protein
MDPDMLETNLSRESSHETRSLTLVDRVREAIAETVARGVSGADVWARSAGQHVLLGLCDQEAFARLTPLGGTLFGLAFRAAGTRASHKNSWEPLLLVDELVDVVEHAIVAIEAVPIQ